MLAGREPHKVKLQEAGSGCRRLWDVLVVFDGEGHMYLGPGWEHFTRAHELQLGYFLVFRYDGDAMFTVKMFDNTMCRMYYQHDDDASKLSASLLPVLLASSTSMTTTPCSHFVAFGHAMGAAAGMTRSKVGKKRSRAGMTRRRPGKNRSRAGMTRSRPGKNRSRAGRCSLF